MNAVMACTSPWHLGRMVAHYYLNPPKKEGAAAAAAAGVGAGAGAGVATLK